MIDEEEDKAVVWLEQVFLRLNERAVKLDNNIYIPIDFMTDTQYIRFDIVRKWILTEGYGE